MRNEFCLMSTSMGVASIYFCWGDIEYGERTSLYTSMFKLSGMPVQTISKKIHVFISSVVYENS